MRQPACLSAACLSPACLLVACVVVAFGFGLLKTWAQVAHPPAYARAGVNSFEGYVAIDGFAHRADRYRAWMVGEDPSPTADLPDELHPNSLAVPFVVGALGVVLGSIPIAFILLSFAATLLAAVGIARLAALPSGDRTWSAPGFMGATIFLSHLLTIRTSGQMLLDTFACAACVWAVISLLRWQQEGSRAHFWGLAAWLILATFIKTSCFAFLAMPLLGCVVLEGVRGLARVGPWACTVVAVLPVVSYLLVALGGRDIDRDADHLLQSWTLSSPELVHFAIEMALLVQVWPLLVWSSRRSWPVASKVCLSISTVILIATWAFKLPAVPRLYLPVLALLVAGVTPVVFRLRSDHRRWVDLGLVVLVGANWLVAAIGLLPLVRAGLME